MNIEIDESCVPTPKFTDYILDIPVLADVLRASSLHHTHLCPRQVLGARIGLAGLNSFKAHVSARNKEILVIAETDGCFLSGLSAATDAFVNHRTLRIVDHGKIAATFIHVQSEKAFRISPQKNIRDKAWVLAPGEESRHYFAMLSAYQHMNEVDLLETRSVNLVRPVAEIISKPGIRAACDRCGEEIINEREVRLKDGIYCLHCSGDDRYFT